MTDRKQLGLAYKELRRIYTVDGLRTVEDGMKMFIEMHQIEVLEGVRDLAAYVLDKVSRRPDHSLSQHTVLEVERLSHAHGELCRHLYEKGHPYPLPVVSVEL